MQRASAVVVTCLAACGGAPAPAVPAGHFATVFARHDLAGIRALLSNRVTNGGVWFADPRCAHEFADIGDITGTRLDTFAECLAALDLHESERTDALPDISVLTYAPGIELEARIIGEAADQHMTWIGYSGCADADTLPTVTPEALEPLRLAGDREVPLDPVSVGPGSTSFAWFKLCVDESGAVTDAQVRLTSSSRATRAFATAMRGWRFKPMLLGGVAAPVCAMYAMTYPVHPDAHESLPMPQAMMPTGAIIIPPRMLMRVKGDLAIAPDAATRDAIQKLHVDKLTGTFQLCLDETGHPSYVRMIRSTGVPG